MKASNPQEPVFYVYALLDPRKPGPFKYRHWSFSHEPFYIGKGKEDRILEHNGKPSRNKHKSNKIAKIQREGHSVIRLIKIGNLLESDAYASERKMISVIGRLDLKTGPLVNLVDGGIGPLQAPGRSKKIRKAALAQHARMSKEEKLVHAKKMSEGHSLMTKEAKEKRSLNSSIAQQKRFAKTTQKEKDEATRKQQETFNTRSEERKSLHRQRLSEKATLDWAKRKRMELTSIKIKLNVSFELRGISKRFIL